MREDEIIAQIKDELEAATPAQVDVRTDGGDQAPAPPEIIIDWSNFRLEGEHGHTSFAETLRDGSGTAVGREFHMYFRMEADCVIRYFDEVTRDLVIDDVQSAFLPYEADSSNFSEDTAEWEVGGGRRSTNSFVENDWYEGGVLLSFKYVKRAQQLAGDTIEAINVDIEPDESIEGTSSETK